jgi:hypothetical protein
MGSPYGQRRRLDADPGPAVPAAANWAQRRTIAPGEEQHLVGESNYQRALEHAAGGGTPVTRGYVQEGVVSPAVPGGLVRRGQQRVELDPVEEGRLAYGGVLLFGVATVGFGIARGIVAAVVNGLAFGFG